MINVIVKTLDGRNHDFAVPDDITVVQFKNIVHEKMDIAVDRQRLLFQGRVLQDENLLSSYNVAGNVMHLVTRPPPSQNRPQPEPSNEREENSDINRDQIRHILSDVFANITELSNPMGNNSVSVNNEGNRVDITVNMPSTNRLSLARLRQNYIHRLMSQARELIENLRDPSHPSPRPDRDRLYQANAYDLDANEERITEVTAQPLPIHNLADMIHSARNLWHEAEPQLELWENVLRRQNLSESISSSDREMQRIHDSASRYIHLFSHMLHIMSDYLVEFQHNSNSRIAVPRNVNDTVTPTNEVATSTSIDEAVHPLTAGCGESALPHSDTSSDASQSATGVPVDTTNSEGSNSDRSRYLYVFSEMPAQLLQVRLDVDSTIQMPSATTVASSNGTPNPIRVQSTRNTEQAFTQPEYMNTGETNPNPSVQETSGVRARRRENQFSVPTTMENFIRSTLQDSFSNQSTRTNGATTRPLRAGSQLIENVDPYVRCQSRHFQNPSNLRSGAVISTFGGIRFRESSRTRPRPTETPVTTTNNINATGGVSSSTETREGDSFRTIIGGLMNSIFPTSGESSPVTTTMTDSNVLASIPRPEATADAATASTSTTLPTNDLARFIQTISSGGSRNLNAPLGQLFPEIFSSYFSNIVENNVTNQIVQLIADRLTIIDFTHIIHGIYHPLNSLRVPLQNLLQRHQEQFDGSRDRMLEHVVMDLQFCNRVYMSIFDQLSSSESVTGLSEDARRNFNHTIDIPRTINNLNRHHARVVVDMILRSPTDIGFGQLLMNSMLSHHNESLALLDIICNDNDELRQYIVHAFESLLTSVDGSLESQVINQARSTFGLDWILGNVTSRLFRRPDQLPELQQIVHTSYVVHIDVNKTNNNTDGAAATATNDDSEQVMANSDCLENMVNSLSGIHKVSDESRSMNICSFQQDIGANHAPNGGSWQSVLPSDWLDIVSRDSNMAVDHTIGIPYSDAYVSGMPPKRRKIIINQRQRNLQPAPEMMQDCLDEAIRAAGINDPQIMQPLGSNLTNSFQELVSDHVRNRLVDESFNFSSERFPSAEQSFNRKKRTDDKKNN